MERPPRTKPAARNTMRVTIKTPPDKKHSPRRDAEKQLSRRSPSATTNKLTIRERFILSFSIPLILVSLGLLMFIAGHVIARMVGRAKARKAERIATAYVEVLNVSLQSTATSEAATAIAAETTSLGAAALLNASQSVVASGTVPVFIDIYVRKGHRLGGGWRSITVAPKILDDYYPVPSLDDAVAPGTIRSDADLKGAVTPVELATIVDDYDRGRAIGLDGATTSTTAARVMGSARRDYISKGIPRVYGIHFPN
ncbi:hypothetical protein MTO96_049481 [Rhipicephalus appendiculatus]